ncbi:U3 small nucleolar RNA-associated protein [Mycena chlorophos]|uniref:U3 small nucleolar RNA-associated protein n=1 Tax=Mycena chlorophos TaxID=658473 RepID=A0A8H6T4Z0_MYCCL|nr:U3 small nucleolar RNA-associated protein [Mycena chlorophos]
MAALTNILNPERLVNSPAWPVLVPNSSGSEDGGEDEVLVYGGAALQHIPHPDCPDSLACLPDTDGRPQHTLPVILRCAILGSPKKRLTIRDIYAAMEEKYAYYRTAGQTWKQSVRHHLSLNRLFERQPRPATEPGFGSYWTVNLLAPPGTKRPRKRGRPNKDAQPTKPTTTQPMIIQESGTIASTSKTKARVIVSAADEDDGEDEADIPPFEEDELEVSECESEEKVLLHPFERRNSLSGRLTPYDPSAGRNIISPTPALVQLQAPPPQQIPSPLTVAPSQINPSSDDVIEQLQMEMASLRRQSAEAISMSMRLSDQLAHAEAEVARTRSALEQTQLQLRDEATRRRQAERDAEQAIKLRGIAEEALKESLRFKNARSIGPLYTSGPVAVSQNGARIVTCLEETALLTDVATGEEICRFTGDTEPITSLCLSPKHLVVFTSALALRVFELPSEPSSKPIQPVRSVARAHEAPVHVCKIDPTNNYVASGSADGVVKVWDIARGFVTHVFKGHGGVVSALAFDFRQDPSSAKLQRTMRLVTGSVDTRIRIFELTDSASRSEGSQKPIAVLEGHVSVPRGLDISQDGKWLISGGRDSVVLVWDLSIMNQASKASAKGKTKAVSPTLARTVPVLERVEAVGLLHPDEDLAGSTSSAEQLRFYTGGENGVVKIWDAREGNILFTLGAPRHVISDEQETQRQIVDLLYLPATSSIISVHADQNIMFHSLSTKSLTRQLIGFNDEIVDARMLSTPKKRDAYLALGTNSSLLRIYSVSDFDARLLEGHSETVLCVDAGVNGALLASGSKDRSARLWASESENEEGAWGYGCVAVCEGHAESVGAIALSRQAGTPEATETHSKFMFTGSQDRTIKMWDLSDVPLVAQSDTDVVKCRSLTTLKAHEKDINALDVSPNDRFLVSGSQDRTANVYEIEYVSGSGGRAARGGLRLVGTCKGHKRGVWTVKFGRAERVLATGSGDKTIKLWNLDDFTCVKTFEGHTNSVLRVEFLTMGMQLVSSGSDGLVKVWNIKDEECVATLDNHQDKVWALTVSEDERTIVSAAADSVVTFWQDCTEEQEVEKETQRADLVLKEQDFLNYLELNDYRRAIQLAISMGQPGRLYNLFNDVRKSAEDAPAGAMASITGNLAVDEVIRTLAGSDLAKLLRYIREWNASAKTSTVAQGVLFAVMKLRPADDVTRAFDAEVNEGAVMEGKDPQSAGTGGTALKDIVDALIPYTERHLARMERLVQESYMVDFVLAEMDGMLGADDEMDLE